MVRPLDLPTRKPLTTTTMKTKTIRQRDALPAFGHNNNIQRTFRREEEEEEEGSARVECRTSG